MPIRKLGSAGGQFAPLADEGASNRLDASAQPADPNRNPDGSYKVGKYQPPAYTRWKPGQSGNPKGSKKPPSDIDTAVVEFMDELVTITTARGSKKKVSHGAALMRKTYELAFKGNIRATKFLFDIYAKAKVQKAATGAPSANLSSAEEEMLSALFEGMGLAPVSGKGGAA